MGDQTCAITIVISGEQRFTLFRCILSHDGYHLHIPDNNVIIRKLKTGVL